MPFTAIILAVSGVALLVVLTANAFTGRPWLQRAEPFLVVLSLVVVFIALQSTITDGAESPRNFRPKSILHEFQFSRYCERRLGGEASFTNDTEYCMRHGFVTHTQTLGH